MKKILPMNSPFIHCYTAYGTLFSILDQNAEPWLLHNFIHTRYAYGWNMYIFNQHQYFLQDCPHLQHISLPSDLITKGKNIIDVITENIDNEFYVYLFIDRYYINNYWAAGRYHAYHEILICGYDTDTGMLYAADNVYNGKYEIFTCPYADFLQAYEHVPEEYDFFKQVSFLQVKRTNHIELSVMQIILGLESYVNSLPHNDLHYAQDYAFGIDSYNILLSCIEDSKSQKLGSLDIRMPHFWYEHKKMMCKRLIYLKEHYKIDNIDRYIETYTQIEADHQVNRSRAIKSSYVTNEQKRLLLLTAMEDTYLRNIEEEKIVLRELIHDLYPFCSYTK